MAGSWGPGSWGQQLRVLGDNSYTVVKYISDDGHHEAVRDPYAGLVTDPVNKGTYNYGTNWLTHLIFDVLPYWLFGNCPDDPTGFFERLGGTYDGPIPSE